MTLSIKNMPTHLLRLIPLVGRCNNNNYCCVIPTYSELSSLSFILSELGFL